MHPPRRITQHHPRHGMIAPMPRTARRTTELGPRLRRLRLERGWTLAQLAERIGGTVRAIFYYEQEGRFPPAPALAKLAEAFGLSMEALMNGEDGKPRRADDHGPNLLQNAEDRRLWKRFNQLRQLSERDRAAVFRMLDGLIAKGDR